MNLKGIEDLKEGDTVLVVHYGTWGRSIAARVVTRVTPKQFRIGASTYASKFRKSDGMQLGARGWGDYAYPNNPENQTEFQEHLEQERIDARGKDLLIHIYAKVKNMDNRGMSKETLCRLERVAEILGIKEQE